MQCVAYILSEEDDSSCKKPPGCTGVPFPPSLACAGAPSIKGRGGSVKFGRKHPSLPLEASTTRFPLDLVPIESLLLEMIMEVEAYVKRGGDWVQVIMMM